jgi:hypothetical protein
VQEPRPHRQYLYLHDTGAFSSVIQQGIAQQLGLHPVGQVLVGTPAATHIALDQFLVRFVFPDQSVREVMVVEAPLQGQHVQCLIGRDILAQSVFMYSGPQGLYSLSL